MLASGFPDISEVNQLQRWCRGAVMAVLVVVDPIRRRQIQDRTEIVRLGKLLDVFLPHGHAAHDVEEVRSDLDTIPMAEVKTGYGVLAA